ncbi:MULTISPECIES: SDR family oxidoreductase [Sutcliffiella]|uniref:NAD(P)-dependent oxidoreductase n=1 Tax=Sutcliffiella cohnii TaxID=33932 RepID=A0A223KN20_9BACI|nr:MULTISPECIES: SDR family oxidoreductase [Sutcliffiella]AST90910.1 NAD(P)-dependent oxidoreductase [Sutcliffiella cohnii]MED4017795.1 SDR family oxidoreductase [Sutcliffiella cohnii]WBL16697.1 SDR family oxidoreductase [Sutcliffiella sp. NC1]
MDRNYPVYPYIGYKKKVVKQPIAFPPQHQEEAPGLEWKMYPRPIYDYAGFKGSGKLQGKIALITGGDSGIGRAVAVAYAKEGANITIVYLNEDYDANETKQYVEKFGVSCLLIRGDLRNPSTSEFAVNQTINKYGRLDIVVHNAAVQPFTEDIMDVSNEQLDDTFRTNVYPLFYMTKASLPYLKKGSSIISTASRVAYEGDKNVIDYATSKGAVVSFTRTMALSLVDKGIRVNAVAPGPAWTPLTVSTYSADHVSTLGTDIPMGRAAQPFEIAPAFVYLATEESYYVTGQVIHVNGGIIRDS